MLHSLGIDTDLGVSANFTRVKTLIAELFALQEEYTETESTVEYHQMQQSTTSHAITVAASSTETAFKRYHRRKPFIKELIDAISPEEDKGVGSRRIAEYLASNHQSVLVDVVNEKGLAVCGIMSNVELCAMLRDAGLIDAQAHIILKHLRYKFYPAKISVPFTKMKSLLTGMTEPRVKTFHHYPPGNSRKRPELVVAFYQSIDKEMMRAVSALLKLHKIHPRLIKRIRLVFGGDHGKGAFRLCFLILICYEGGELPVYTTVACADVYCRKEEGLILEETIMKWLEADLKRVFDSELVIEEASVEDGIIRDDRCTVVSDYETKIKLITPNTMASTSKRKVIKVEQLLAGDFAFQSYCLGKEDMSGIWCLYCLLRANEWSEKNHKKGTLWTIQSLTAMAGSSKTGVDRLGVKVEPKFPWIPVSH